VKHGEGPAGGMTGPLRTVRLSDVPLVNFRLLPGVVYSFECYRCNGERPMILPGHPAGLARCSACGVGIDLCDQDGDGRRRYFACYELRHSDAAGERQGRGTR
jgi:hypothetical protein